MDESTNESVVFTRYLYNKENVKHSLLLAILDHNNDEALFWTYELYYSGFYDELIDLILLIYKQIFIYTNKKLIHFIERNIKLMEQNPENDSYIGSIISTFVHRTYNLIPFIEKYFKVKCINDKNLESPSIRLNINLNDDDIISYKTVYGSPTSILKKTNKYPIRKYINRLFNGNFFEHHDLINMYNIHWLYYAYISPIWKLRLDKYNIIINDNTQIIDFIDDDTTEKFYSEWGYDPEEQPLIVREYHIGTGNEKQFDIKDFCKTYNVNIVTKKRTMRTIL
jgi:hypothetical protein